MRHVLTETASHEIEGLACPPCLLQPLITGDEHMGSQPAVSYTSFDFSLLAPRERYKLLISLIVPRPIALVSTLSAQGVGNLAPFSFFNGISSDPPCLMISVARKPDGTKKDTLLNIEETGEFVVNTSHEWMLDPLVLCGAEFPYGTDERLVSGFTAIPSQLVKPIRIKESSAQFECRLHQIVEIGSGGAGSSSVIFGRILTAHVVETLIEQGRVQHDRQKPLARLGGIGYCGIANLEERAIPDVKNIPPTS